MVESNNDIIEAAQCNRGADNLRRIFYLDLLVGVWCPPC